MAQQYTSEDQLWINVTDRYDKYDGDALNINSSFPGIAIGCAYKVSIYHQEGDVQPRTTYHCTLFNTIG